MSPVPLTVVLTALAAVVVVLTRVRLARADGAGRLSIPPAVLATHTASGVPAALRWALFLLSGAAWLGALGLVLWWVTAVAGLLVLARWIPARGRHSSAARADTWGEGPGPSIPAHLGLLAGVVTFTVLVVRGDL